MLKLAKVILTQSTLLSLKTLRESEIGAKGRGERRLECLGAVLDEGWRAINEWVTVRREERAIYTRRQNLTVQICVRSSDTDHRNFWPFVKHCSRHSQRWSTQLEPKLLAKHRNFWQSGLSTHVGTPDPEPSQGAKSQSAETSGGSRNFRHQELPTPVGTSDGRASTGGLKAKSSSAGTSDTKC